MTTTATGSPLPVQYLLAVTGQSKARIDAFIAQAEGADPRKPFHPPRVMPVPGDLKDINPFSMPYYHLLAGRWKQAADLLDRLGGDEEFVAMLRDPQRATQAQNYFSKHADAEALEGVQAVKDNLDRHGVMTRAQWTAQNWAWMTAELESERQRPADVRVTYRFSSPAFDLRFVDTLADLYPDLAFGAIAVDRTGGHEVHAWQHVGENFFFNDRRALDPLRETWLQRPPELFKLVGA